MSNRGRNAFSAAPRSSRILSSPILYASAWPGHAMYRSTSFGMFSNVDDVFYAMNSIACWRVHPSACIPVSTTRRHARHIS